MPFVDREEWERMRRRYWLLGKPGVTRILAILYEHGPMPLHHVPRYGIGVGTTYKSAELAARLGLVRLYVCGSSKCAELTPEGRRVAEKLVEAIDEFLTPVKKAEAINRASGVQV